ncbi:MAG TPA: hypothetical protein DCG28_03670 [Lachnospiraceae bacterium]|nr:hypothetical protein [Lachnospiraceae bacterium]
MTDKEKAVVMAYTGICMLKGDKFQIFLKYVADIMNEPIETYELGSLADEIKKRAKADFIELCANESSSENPTGSTTKNDLANDCISRKSIKLKLQELYNVFIDAYGCFSKLPMLYKAKVDGITDCIAAVENEPSISPQPKIGYWIRADKGKLKCSECDIVHFIEQYPMGKIDWCPNCGTKMQKRIEEGEEMI